MLKAFINLPSLDREVAPTQIFANANHKAANAKRNYSTIHKRETKDANPKVRTIECLKYKPTIENTKRKRVCN